MRRSCVWVVAIAIPGIFGCSKARQESVEQARAAPVTAAPSEEEDREHMEIAPSERALRRQRLVSVLTKHPDAYLTLRGETPSLDMRPRVAKPVAFRLAVPGVERWTEANIGRFDVRFGDTQESIAYDKLDARGALSYTFAAAGPAMFLFCAGPPVEKKGPLYEKVTHCSKIIVNVTDPQNRPRAREISMTHETGLAFEVTPMVAPVDLSVGQELPVVFGYLNEELENSDVAALRPDGSIDHQTTDRVGIAHFQISQVGRWVIRFVKNEPEGERVGELVFDVMENKR